ncbi:MAG TPA: sulfatase [Thermoanaerobaculia bacterium]|nr:sulfatase [Thermoanaerobaculia bacterium]
MRVLCVAGVLVAMLLASSAAGTNIVLVSVDTLRADRLPAYGYRAIRTPAIDRFRADSVLFRRAWTHCPLTAPAHASMLTGLLPQQHGLRDNSGYALDRRVATVAEQLQSRGYRTGAFVSSVVLGKEDTKLDRGFERWDETFAEGEKTRKGDATVAAALAWLDERKGRPFFLFVHTYEPHTPYEKLPGVADAYDAEVVRSDGIVGALFDALRSRKLYDDALILFTSDHGEGLGEHDEPEHGTLLYRTTLQIPLIVKLPGAALRGKSVAADAQLIDLAPSMLEHAGLPREAARLSGMSLAKLARSGSASRAIHAETLYPRNQLGWHELRSVVRGDLHLIAGRRVALHDLRTDPGERVNLADARRREAFALLQEVKRVAAAAKRPSASTSAKTAEALQSLGYLSGGSGDETTYHPDPRDRMPIFGQQLKLMTALRRAQYDEALARADAILARHPSFIEVWERKAIALLGLGRRKEAEEAVQRAMKLMRP